MAASCGAQRQFATDPLDRGQLVLWVVQTDPPPQPTADEVRRTLHTATAGSFGQDAGNVGHTAGSYGANPSQVGTGVGSRTAGSTGQTAGSFGYSLDTIAGAGTPAGTTPFEPAALGFVWETFATGLKRSFPSLRLHVLAVRALDLQARFAALGPQDERPDVLLGDTGMVDRNPFLGSMVLARLGVAAENELPPDIHNRLSPPIQREWLILGDAPHPAEARAFVVWLRDGQRARAEKDHWGIAPDSLRSLATAAAESLLRGAPITAADRTMVAYSPAVARRMALNAPSDETATGVEVRINIMAEAANERFAVFALRAVVGSPQAFGVVYPMVVLRHGDDGRWTVLHVTGDLTAPGFSDGVGPLQPYTQSLPLEKVKAIRGIGQAAPIDGDTRAGTPDLWWDDPGEAEELVVEWSRNNGDAHLVYIPDTGSRLKVRVPATFANIPGEYRWRVWSVGAGGVLDLSPWRRLTILP